MMTLWYDNLSYLFFKKKYSVLSISWMFISPSNRRGQLGSCPQYRVGGKKIGGLWRIPDNIINLGILCWLQNLFNFLFDLYFKLNFLGAIFLQSRLKLPVKTIVDFKKTKMISKKIYITMIY
jgi:hypothetical protein